MTKCSACLDGRPLGFEIQMALQPILDLARGEVWGYEALVRGANGEGAGSVLAGVDEGNRYKFDQACRVKAIEAAGARFDAPNLYLSINFMPNAVYEPAACIRSTMIAAEAAKFPISRIMFEFTEDEMIRDADHINKILRAYKEFGFLTALDDFGAGYAGLSRFADTQTDVIKLDMQLIRGVETCHARRAIVRGLSVMAQDMGVRLLAEGVETRAEYVALEDIGVTLFQGYYFGRPTLGRLDSRAIAAQAVGAGAMESRKVS